MVVARCLLLRRGDCSSQSGETGLIQNHSGKLLEGQGIRGQCPWHSCPRLEVALCVVHPKWRGRVQCLSLEERGPGPEGGKPKLPLPSCSCCQPLALCRKWRQTGTEASGKPEPKVQGSLPEGRGCVFGQAIVLAALGGREGGCRSPMNFDTILPSFTNGREYL